MHDTYILMLAKRKIIDGHAIHICHAIKLVGEEYPEHMGRANQLIDWIVSMILPYHTVVAWLCGHSELFDKYFLYKAIKLQERYRIEWLDYLIKLIIDGKV
jgi:hypothetical protein